MASTGQGLFYLYIYIENFKNLLVRNHWADYSITWQKYSLWPSTKIVQAIKIRQKAWPPGGGTYFSYISVQKIFKIFLSETTGPISM